MTMKKSVHLKIDKQKLSNLNNREKVKNKEVYSLRDL